jgi:cytokinin dehydrogenase
MRCRIVQEPTRRSFVRGIAVGAVITGFDPLNRNWISDIRRRRSVRQVPPLKGRLIFDDADLTDAADDFGHIVHRRPVAVLQPGSIEDIAVMLRFCHDLRITVAARGQGHATYG